MSGSFKNPEYTIRQETLSIESVILCRVIGAICYELEKLVRLKTLVMENVICCCVKGVLKTADIS